MDIRWQRWFHLENRKPSRLKTSVENPLILLQNIHAFIRFFLYLHLIDVLFPVIQAKSVSTDTETPVIFGAEPPKLKSVSDKGDNGVRQGIILEPETIENIAEGDITFQRSP